MEDRKKVSPRLGQALRFTLRYILRTPAKSLLCLLLAGAFMAALMFIRVSAIRSEARLEELYATIAVKLELLPNQLGVSYSVGPIQEHVVAHIGEAGFVRDQYLEGQLESISVTPRDAETGKRFFPTWYLEAEEAGTDEQKRLDYDLQFINIPLYGVRSAEEYFEQNRITGSIEYRDGWDSSVFSMAWDEDDPIYPVVISQNLYDLIMEGSDGTGMQVTVDVQEQYGYQKSRTKLTVVGTSAQLNRQLLFPLDVLRHLPGVQRLSYGRAIFTLDPAKNRQLDSFRELVAAETAANSLTPVFWDQQLRQAVEPVEQVISLMNTLYPVAVALSALVAAGVAILLTLMSAREAAILRVLGNSKARCRVILCLQTVLVCVVGLIIGHFVAVGMAGAMLAPEAAAGLALPALRRAGLYLLAAIAGAAAASIAMTAKNPLELLQVKE